MNAFVCFAFLFVAVTAEVAPVIKECKEELKSEIEGATEEEKHEKVGKCLLEKQGLITDGKLDYPKYKKESEEYITPAMKDKVLEALDELWKGANEDCKTFFKNMKPKLQEICPEDKFECNGEI